MTEQFSDFLDFTRREQERLEREQERQTIFARSATARRRGALADRPGFVGLVGVGAAAGQLTDARLRARIEQLRGRAGPTPPPTPPPPGMVAPPEFRAAFGGGRGVRRPTGDAKTPTEAQEQIAAFDAAIGAEQTGRAEQRRVQTGEEFAVRDRLLEIRTGLEDLVEPRFADPDEVTRLEELGAQWREIGAERSGRYAGREDLAELLADLEARLAAARARRERPPPSVVESDPAESR